MARFMTALLALLAFVPVLGAQADSPWTEGVNYTRIQPAQRTNVAAGKVEVMEVFSYGCIACNSFQPTIEKLKKSLPANAQMVFLPAAFNTSEDWPIFQRAYFVAQELGIAERTHQAMFDAIWGTGELAITDPVTHALKSPQPSLEDVARCYAHLAGIKPQDFIAASKSFNVDRKIRAADDQVAAMQVPGTPCLVVNGKYRVNMEKLRTSDDLIELVKYLVNKEGAQIKS